MSHIQHDMHTHTHTHTTNEFHNLCSDIYPYKFVGIENAAVLNGNDIDISPQCLSI